MVRDLAERGVLRGNRGAYLSTAEVAEISVPATLQATIAARIDRLGQAHLERGGGHRRAVQPRLTRNAGD
jgi:predicted ATPase